MTSLNEHILHKHFFASSDDDVVLQEGVAAFVQNHPFMASMAAGYLLSKTLKRNAGSSTIDVVTHKMKFFARTSVERKIQKQLVDTLLQSKHYSLVSSKQEGDVFVWTLKRLAR